VEDYRVVRCRDFHILWTFGTKVAVRLSVLCAGRPLFQGICVVLISVRCSVNARAMVRLEGLRQLINLTRSLGIEPATLQFVVSASTTSATAWPAMISIDCRNMFRISKSVFVERTMLFWVLKSAIVHICRVSTCMAAGFLNIKLE
jgi:hypothetical protein